MKWKICSAFILTAAILLGGCGTGGEPVTVVTRESGSGTRYSFNSLAGVTETIETEVRDRTAPSALVMGSTGSVMLKISQDRNAIGYISAAAVRPSVKVLAVDGVLPDAEHIRDRSYPLIRSVYLMFRKDSGNPVIADFLDFARSREGAEILQEYGFTAPEKGNTFRGGQASGYAVIGGSSSLGPVMQRLVDAYEEYNPRARIDLEERDSLMGIRSVLSGTISMGFASRPLTEEEHASGAEEMLFAGEGIAVIVNPANPVSDISSRELRDVYTGRISQWTALRKGDAL